MSDEPAFPRTGEGFGNPKYDHPGMTIRDWFAGQALASLAREQGFSQALQNEVDLAARCFALADAMLAARTPTKDERP